MKITPRKLNRKLLRAKSPKALGVTIALLALVVSGVVVFAIERGSGYAGGAGSGGNSQGKCKSGNCKSVRKNGAYWLLVPAASDSINPASLFGLVEKKGNITGCKSGGGYFYVLVTPLSGGGLAGPISIDTVPSNGRHDSGSRGNLSGARNVSWTEAQNAFNKNADFYATKGQRWSGTGLAWFCADPKAAGESGGVETIEAAPEQGTPTPPYSTNSQYGATFSRIAVENMSLDGMTPTTSEWRAGVNPGSSTGVVMSSRSGQFRSDTGVVLNADNAEVETYAKPGDSVHFLHEVYMGNRAVKMATTWELNGREHSYEELYPGVIRDNEIPSDQVPVQKITIDGLYNDSRNSNFRFSDPIQYAGVDFVNARSEYTSMVGSGWWWDSHGSRSDYDHPFYSNQLNSVSATGDGLGVGVISPSIYNGNYSCWEYNASDPFVDGGFQIPGFYSSQYYTYNSCRSASLVNESNFVGKTFGQMHEVNNTKIWEKYGTTTTGSCGCNYNYNHYEYTTTYDAYDRSSTTGPTITNYNNGSEGRDAAIGEYVTRDNYTTGGLANGHRKEYKCKSTPSDTCHYEQVRVTHYYYEYRPRRGCSYDMYGTAYNCDVEEREAYDTYGDSESAYTGNRYDFTDDSYKITFETVIDNSSMITKKAKVYVPYNFLTSVGSNINTSNDIVYQGSKVESTGYWKIDPRDNNFTSYFPYATITPDDVEVRMIEFLYDPGEHETQGESNVTNERWDRRSWYDLPCDYYKANGAQHCQILYSTSDPSTIEDEKPPYNRDGDYDGSSTYSHHASRIVPDDGEYVGWKYCIAVGINYTSSHSTTTSPNDDSLNTQKAASTNNIRKSWNISDASCVTIAKKPNFQVWNGSVYTKGDITTSSSKKALGASIGNYDSSGLSTTLFGSWVDYMIIANGSVNGISSGAMLGYNRGRDNGFAEDYHFNLSGGNRGMINNQDRNPVTISNARKNNIGESGVDASASINNTLNRLKTRYKEKAQTFANSMGSINQKRIRTASTGMQYLVHNGDLSISEIGDRDSSDISNPNYGTTHRDSALYKELGKTGADNTLVIVVEGTLNIDQNICLSRTYYKCTSDATMLYSYDDISTNASSQLPQILIFAKNVKISEDVTRIDAWLIVDEGEINTCDGFRPNSYDGTRAFYATTSGNYPDNRVVSSNAPNADLSTNRAKCYKTLVVNGPIFASSLKLYRTAGNYHGAGSYADYDVRGRSIGGTGGDDDPTKGSIAPAEIFNLRADAYIWAYNQAERYSEAVVTYTRELAPRY